MWKEEMKNVEVLPEMEEVEGYASCNTNAKECWDDCVWPFAAQVLSYAH